MNEKTSRRRFVTATGSLAALGAAAGCLGGDGGSGSSDGDSGSSDGGSGGDTAATDAAATTDAGSQYGEITGPYRLRMWHERYGNAVVEEFAEEWGIQASNNGFSSPSAPYTQIQSGQYAGDTISFIHNWGQRAWENDLLQPVDTSRLSHLDNLDDRWQEMNSVGENEQWGIPYDVGIFPLTYNTDEISDNPGSWDLLWDDAYEGRITMQDSAINSCQVAALYTGQDPLAPDDFDDIEEALMQQKPLVNTYWGTFERGMRLFVDGSVDVGQLTVGRTIQAAVDNDTNVDYTVPSEGAMTYFDEFCIPTNAENPGTAHAWIDDYLEQGGPRFTEMERYRSTVADLDSKMPDELQGWYAWPDEWNLVNQDLLSDEVRSNYEEIWTRVLG